jgi:hypothetical protein
LLVELLEVGLKKGGATPAEEGVAVDAQPFGDESGAVPGDKVADGCELEWGEGAGMAGGFVLRGDVLMVRRGEWWCAMVRGGALRGCGGWCAVVRGLGVVLAGGFVPRELVFMVRGVVWWCAMVRCGARG